MRQGSSKVQLQAAARGTDWSWQNMAVVDYLHGPVNITKTVPHLPGT